MEIEDEDGDSDPGAGEVWTRVLYSMILNMLEGFLEDVITVDTPAAVAISAAISFVSIPPVPRLEPRVAVLTAKAHVNTRRHWSETDGQGTYLAIEWQIWM